MRVSIMTGLFVLFGVGALAVEEPPLTEVCLPYQMLRPNSSRNVPFEISFIDQPAAAAELGAEHNGNVYDIQLDNTWWTYLFGPGVSLTKRYSRIVPAFECLLGEIKVAGIIKSPLLPDIPGARVTGGQNAFAAAVGGTLDIRLNRRLTLRPIQADHLLTRLQSKTLLNGIETFSQNNFRFSAGKSSAFGSYAVD
jgi:hypothetical protein